MRRDRRAGRFREHSQQTIDADFAHLEQAIAGLLDGLQTADGL
ncbi:MAG: hypothetical protein ACRDJX_01375 [Solirubrobacteraceae bacterium]